MRNENIDLVRVEALKGLLDVYKTAYAEGLINEQTFKNGLLRVECGLKGYAFN